MLVLVPRFIDTLNGLIVNDGGTTVSWKVVEALSEPEVPVTVTAALLIGAVVLAVIVRVELYVAGFGAQDAVTPAGRPLTEKLTAPVKP